MRELRNNNVEIGGRARPAMDAAACSPRGAVAFSTLAAVAWLREKLRLISLARSNGSDVARSPFTLLKSACPEKNSGDLE